MLSPSPPSRSRSLALAAADEGAVAHLCVSTVRSNSPAAASIARVKIPRAASAKRGGSIGRKSSPTRASEPPQYPQCSITDASAPPSSIRGSVFSTSARYSPTLCALQPYRSPPSAPSASSASSPLSSSSPSAPSPKMARYCMTTSKRCTLCRSVSRLRYSYALPSSRSATASATWPSRHRRNVRLSPTSSSALIRRR